jgi:MFS family permease
MADDRYADEALRALFAELPDPPDEGFSERVVGRIASRVRRRRLIIAAAVLVGALIAVWPVGQLLLQLSDGLRDLAVGIAGRDWLSEYRTPILGVGLAFLTPVVAALLED